jgi:hypothetical protein
MDVSCTFPVSMPHHPLIHRLVPSTHQQRFAVMLPVVLLLALQCCLVVPQHHCHHNYHSDAENSHRFVLCCSIAPHKHRTSDAVPHIYAHIGGTRCKAMGGHPERMQHSYVVAVAVLRAVCAL